ncbi:hypothetical protein GCM10027053_44070 [Intrasporangium mesophilum]
MMWDWGHMSMGSSQVLFWVVLFALIAGGTVVAVLVLSRDERARDRGRTDEDVSATDGAAGSPAEAELEMRYARGDIDAEALARGRAALRQR